MLLCGLRCEISSVPNASLVTLSKTETTDLRCVIMRKEFQAGRHTIIPQAVKGSGQFYLRIFSRQNFQAQQLGN
jgi:hypothetical protein